MGCGIDKIATSLYAAIYCTCVSEEDCIYRQTVVKCIMGIVLLYSGMLASFSTTYENLF